MKFIQMLRPELHFTVFRLEEGNGERFDLSKSRLIEKVLHLEKQRKDKQDIL